MLDFSHLDKYDITVHARAIFLELNEASITLDLNSDELSFSNGVGLGVTKETANSLKRYLKERALKHDQSIINSL